MKNIKCKSWIHSVCWIDLMRYEAFIRNRVRLNISDPLHAYTVKLYAKDILSMKNYDFILENLLHCALHLHEYCKNNLSEMEFLQFERFFSFCFRSILQILIDSTSSKYLSSRKKIFLEKRSNWNRKSLKYFSFPFPFFIPLAE